MNSKLKAFRTTWTFIVVKSVALATWFWGPDTVRARTDLAKGLDLLVKALLPIIIANLFKDASLVAAILKSMFGTDVGAVVASPAEFALICKIAITATVTSFLMKIKLPKD